MFGKFFLHLSPSWNFLGQEWITNRFYLNNGEAMKHKHLIYVVWIWLPFFLFAVYRCSGKVRKWKNLAPKKTPPQIILGLDKLLEFLGGSIFVHVALVFCSEQNRETSQTVLLLFLVQRLVVFFLSLILCNKFVLRCSFYVIFLFNRYSC